MSEDGVDQPIRLEQPNLPDLEKDLHAELIADVEESLMKQNSLVRDSCLESRQPLRYMESHKIPHLTKQSTC